MSTMRSDFTNIFSRNWGWLFLRGLVAIAFAVLAFYLPRTAFISLVLLFGAYALVDGIFRFIFIMGVLGRKEHHDWWIVMLSGLAGAAVGILALIVPSITGLALLFYIAIWAIVIGVLDIATGVHLRQEIRGEWLLYLIGIIAIGFGIYLMAQPARGALMLVYLIAGLALFFGILLIALAFRARSFGHRLVPGMPESGLQH